jgi:Peptidase family M20/M25/M40
MANASSANLILSNLERLLPDLEALYKDVHSHPELSMQETRTAALAADRLRASNYEVTAGIGKTGVVGLLRNGDGPTVMLRADMDALPVEEATGLAYASTVKVTDRDGKSVPVGHMCGHDMHVAWLAGAANLFSLTREAWHGTLMVVFQPGEETAQGAQAMIDDGLFKRFPKPAVVLGQHVMLGPSGTIAGSAGPITSAADSLQIRLFGRGAHGSMPQASIDPVVMAAATVQLETIALQGGLYTAVNHCHEWRRNLRLQPFNRPKSIRRRNFQKSGGVSDTALRQHVVSDEQRCDVHHSSPALEAPLPSQELSAGVWSSTSLACRITFRPSDAERIPLEAGDANGGIASRCRHHLRARYLGLDAFATPCSRHAPNGAGHGAKAKTTYWDDLNLRRPRLTCRLRHPACAGPSPLASVFQRVSRWSIPACAWTFAESLKPLLQTGICIGDLVVVVEHASVQDGI